MKLFPQFGGGRASRGVASAILRDNHPEQIHGLNYIIQTPIDEMGIVNDTIMEWV